MAPTTAQHNGLPTASRKRSSVRNAFDNLPRIFSDWSTPSAEGYWCSQDFMLGAGMVIIQPETRKVVCVWERERKYWFLPKGRKDVGQSLEETALREAYEETGYRATFLPTYHYHNQPSPTYQYYPSTEPIFIHLMTWGPRYRGDKMVDPGGEYLTTWYIGQIAADAVYELNTGMADEVNYESHLLSFEDALRALAPDPAQHAVSQRNFQHTVMHYAIKVFMETEHMQAKAAREQAAQEGMQTARESTHEGAQTADASAATGATTTATGLVPECTTAAQPPVLGA